MRTIHATLVLTFLLVFTARADIMEIKKAMAQRLPAINKLKSSLAVGENNQGYLAARKELTKEELKLIEAENADRKRIYQFLAMKTGTTAEKVGTRRAAQIAERSKAGLWLQKADGTWYKKPSNETAE